MPRIPINHISWSTQDTCSWLYIDHHVKYSITNGIISSIFPSGALTLNLLSAPRFFDAAILADVVQGRVVGYMGGNLDSSK